MDVEPNLEPGAEAGEALVRMTPGTAGRALSIAGVAALTLYRAGHHEAAERTADLQDAVDEQLTLAPFEDVFVPRELVEAAALLWEEAAEALETASAGRPGSADLASPAEERPAFSRPPKAARLRREASRLRSLPAAARQTPR